MSGGSRYFFSVREFGSRPEARAAAYDFARDTRERYRVYAKVRAAKTGYRVTTGEPYGAIGQAVDKESRRRTKRSRGRNRGWLSRWF